VYPIKGKCAGGTIRPQSSIFLSRLKLQNLFVLQVILFCFRYFQISEKIKSELENEIEKELENTNYVIKDFIDGIAYDNKNKREINLGKVLSELSKKDSSKKHLLDRFNSSTDREGKKVKDVMMVISRHPYDILGQSYDRGWTSCTKLGVGTVESESLKDEIFITIIAYLIYKDDKNIKRPMPTTSLIQRGIGSLYITSHLPTFSPICDGTLSIP
jgi:hypothetical protein